MSFDFHENRIVYFQHQQSNAVNHVIPFIEEKSAISSGCRVLEIGCGEGGVLKAFLDKGCTGIGVELDESKANMARQFLAQDIQSGKAAIINSNIYDVGFSTEYAHAFDLIILKDVIEHIFDQQKLIGILRTYLKTGGYIFFGFPPWQMPFGGHQQVCNSKFLSLLPWFHLLPVFLYKAILKLFGEPEGTVKELLEIKETGISIERFEKIVNQTGYSIAHERQYLINPIYAWKFGIKPRLQFRWVNHLPFLRNFITTCSYYLIQNKQV